MVHRARKASRPRRGRSRRHSLVAAVAAGAVLASLAPPAGFAERSAAAGGPSTSKAAAQQRVGELPERRTRTSLTRREADGRLRTTIFGEPVHYRAKDGSWQRIDSALHEMAPPDERGGYRWQNGANEFDVRFKVQAAPDFLAVRLDGGEFRLSATGARPAVAQVAGSSVVYPGAFDGADLRYAVTATGVKETITLADAAAPSSYEFRLRAPAAGAPVEAERRDDGSWAFFRAPSARPVFVLEAPTVAETGGSKEVAPPDPGARPRLDVRRDGRDFVLRLSLDESWLRARGRRFPVVVDPTLTVQPDVDDASWPAGGNYLPFLSERLYVGGGSSYAWRAGLRFDLGAVPAGVTVQSASMSLYYDGYCMVAAAPGHCGGMDHVIDAHRMTGAWTTATTSGQVQFDPTATSSYTFPANPPLTWLTWNMTGLVRDWLAGAVPNYGVLLKRRAEALDVSGPALPGRRYTGSATLQPRLDVTYLGVAVDLMAPTTLHADGAELEWTRYSGPSGAPFDRYEVHRATGSASFTPGPATRLTTIRDINTTRFRDTAAAAGTAFTYRIVANTAASNAQTVTLPADGRAVKLLQPGPDIGKSTFAYWASGLTNCANYGAETDVFVGTTTTNKYRGLVQFDLRDIPATATITSATMSLWEEWLGDTAVTVNAHRATRAWQEGAGRSTCTGDGATWYEATGGQPWTAQGGDFDPAVEASVSRPATSQPNFHDFAITGLVQRWVRGEVPNHGVALKLSNEALTAGNYLLYHTDDFTVAPSLRPKLRVEYMDGSHARGPAVAVSRPTAGQRVAGSTTVDVGASDDRRVEQVQLRVDGNALPPDSSPPYAFTWNTATVGNGSHTLTAVATDDAGNTTSAGVAVDVRNTNPPQATLGVVASTVSGTVTLTAAAGDDFGVSRVEFYVDGKLIGDPDAAAPWQAAWNTLDAGMPAYDGPHALTVKAFDAEGQASNPGAGTAVTVANAAGTLYRATLASTPAPPTVSYDPVAGASQELQGVDVTVTNDSGSPFDGADITVGYRWYAPGAATPAASGSTPLGAELRQNRTSTPVRLLIPPPVLPDGVNLAAYRLDLDLRQASTGVWFADRGNPPLSNPVIVARKLSTALGLERYYAYDSADVGGMTHLVNVANGNTLLRRTLLSSPGRGLSTVVDLTYNGLEEHSDSPAGNNWSLAISGLTRLGYGLDLHPNKADEIAGRSNKYATFVDGDGTRHRFDGQTQPDGTTRWAEPAGVNLYLRRASTTDDTRAWVLTRPDNVRFFFDVDGYPTAVADRNGNTLTFELAPVPPGEDPGGPKKRVARVVDADGEAYTIDYYSKAEAHKPQVRGKVQAVADHSGHRVGFTYYHDGNLLRLTEQGGTTAAGRPLADRSWVFTYMNNTGAGPALGDAARVNPDPGDPAARSQATRLFAVRAPRDVAADADANPATVGKETRFGYFGAADGPPLRWRAKSRTARDGMLTTYGYDTTALKTTVTAPEARVTTFAYGTAGLPSQVTRTVGGQAQHIYLTWTADRQVESISDATTGPATGAARQMFAYNPNGYPTAITNQAGEKTVLDYRNDPVDAADVAGHLSLLIRRTNPKGVPTTADLTDYATDVGHDLKGNPTSVTLPPDAAGVRHTARTTYNPDGTVATVTDARGKTTTFERYHDSGQTEWVRDPLGRVTRIGYDPDGRVMFVQDPVHADESADPWTDAVAARRVYATVYDYDAFGRAGRVSTPKSTRDEQGVLIWASRLLDAHDNVVRAGEPQYGADDPDDGPASMFTYDVMDRLTVAANPDTSVDAAGERTGYGYDTAGRVIRVTTPKGTASAAVADDFAAAYVYDQLDRVVRAERKEVTGAARVERTHVCYETDGDVASVTAPNANLATVACPATQATGFTATYTHDAAHRVRSAKDAESRTVSQTYDPNGNVDTSTDQAGTVTAYAHDQRDRPVRQTEKLDLAVGGHDLVTQWRYDENGNLAALVPPRAYDADNGAGAYAQHVTRYDYDDADQLVRVRHPTSSAYSEQHYTHYGYDRDGRLTLATLPVAAASPAGLPAAARTQLSLFDPGWVRTSDDGVNPAVTFDYTEQGWQAVRTPARSRSDATPDTGQQMSWTYDADGMPAEVADRGGQVSTYDYDANNRLARAVEGRGLVDPGESRREVHARYDGFDRLGSVYSKRSQDASFKAAAYGYDLDGNLVDRGLDGAATAVGGTVSGPRRTKYWYDRTARLRTQIDYGASVACSNERRIRSDHTPTGSLSSRAIAKSTATCSSGDTTVLTPDATSWTLGIHTSAWAWLLNGKLKTATTRDRAGAVVESHTVGYLDSAGDWADGQRTSDTFQLKGPGSTNCAAAACAATYSYDPRGRLVGSTDGHSGATTYTLDQPERNTAPMVRAGNVTTEARPGATTAQSYAGAQLVEVARGPVVNKYWHDELGNLDCVTTGAGGRADCDPAGGAAASLVADYTYDYLDRLAAARSYAAGSLTDTSTYVYDALNRPVRQVEDHITANLGRATTFAYEGLSERVYQETLNTTKPDRVETENKYYDYDPAGHRLTFTDILTTTLTGATPTTARANYTYGYDVHGSVAALLDDGTGTAGAAAPPVKAVYGYRPYGATDTTLTKGDPKPLEPVNPYRYTAKRLDPGSGTLDMGARRYAPQVGRFAQADRYHGAVADLGLSLDPLTGNRYALAAGSPVGFAETDGHAVTEDGSGATAPSVRAAAEDPSTIDYHNSNPNRGEPTVNDAASETRQRGRERRARQAYQTAGMSEYARQCTRNQDECQAFLELGDASAALDAIAGLLAPPPSACAPDKIGGGLDCWLERFLTYGSMTGGVRGPVPRAPRGVPAAKGGGALVKYDADFAIGQLTKGGRGSASGLVDLAESQGWKAVQSSGGPLKYIDESGIERLVIKRGSARAPGSGFPHVEIRNAAGQRVDPYGNLVTRRSPGNHTPITWDLP